MPGYYNPGSYMNTGGRSAQNQMAADIAKRQADAQRLQISEMERERGQQEADRARDENNRLQEADRQRQDVQQQQMYAAPRSTSSSMATAYQPNVAQMMERLQLSLPARAQAPAAIAPPAVPELTGPSAAFSRAKDVSGRTGTAALKALKDVMSNRGMGGSGMEGELSSQILSGVQNQQAGAEYDAATQDAARRWESSKLGYQGALDRNQQLYSGDINQRSQDLNALLALLNYRY